MKYHIDIHHYTISNRALLFVLMIIRFRIRLYAETDSRMSLNLFCIIQISFKSLFKIIMQNHGIKSLIKTNLSAGLVVYLVALPLCLGIAVASGAPPLAGIISGIIGGLVVGWLSTSHISVSGPSPGLTAILIAGITDLGSFELILLAGLISGLI